MPSGRSWGNAAPTRGPRVLAGVAHSDPRVREVILHPNPIELPNAVIPRFDVVVSSYVFEREAIARLANLSYMLGKHLDHAIGLALPGHFPDRTFSAPFPLDLS